MPPLLVGVAKPSLRQFTAAAELPASGSPHDDAHEDQAAKTAHNQMRLKPDPLDGTGNCSPV